MYPLSNLQELREVTHTCAFLVRMGLSHVLQVGAHLLLFLPESSRLLKTSDP